MKKLLLLASLLLVSCGAETVTVYCREEIKRIEVTETETTQTGWIDRTSWYLDTLEICE